jgi:RNA polymerase sigma factor (sigma-70 family)
VAEVPEREREILSLRYGAEMNASEIAEIFNLNPAGVRKICERWRDRLAARIEELQATGEGGSHG